MSRKFLTAINLPTTAPASPQTGDLWVDPTEDYGVGGETELVVPVLLNSAAGADKAIGVKITADADDRLTVRADGVLEFKGGAQPELWDLVAAADEADIRDTGWAVMGGIGSASTRTFHIISFHPSSYAFSFYEHLNAGLFVGQGWSLHPTNWNPTDIATDYTGLQIGAANEYTTFWAASNRILHIGTNGFSFGGDSSGNGAERRITERGDSLVLPSTKTGNTTLALVDSGKAIEHNNTTTGTYTVPPNSSVAFPIGTVIEFYRMGTGTMTIAPGAGVTIRSPGNLLSLRAQYSSASIRKRATDEWVLAGDLV